MPGVSAIRRQNDENTSTQVTSVFSPSTFTVTPSPSSESNSGGDSSGGGGGIPKIGGSEGGFIGLVVGLGVIFIISCAGVFFLLHYRPHGGRTTRDKSGEIGKEVPKRRGTLFGFRSKNPRKGGWVPAPESADDDWDDGFDRVRGERTSTTVHSANDTELGDAGKFTHTIQPNRASLSLSNEVYSSSEDKGRDKRVPHSTELVAQTHNRGFDHLYNDPFGDRGRSPGPIRSPSPERYEESIRSRSVSPRDQQHGHRSTASASSTVSLPSGTRFMESL